MLIAFKNDTFLEYEGLLILPHATASLAQCNLGVFSFASMLLTLNYSNQQDPRSIQALFVAHLKAHQPSISVTTGAACG